MTRILLLLAMFHGALFGGLLGPAWERTGPDIDPKGKPTGQTAPASPDAGPVWDATGLDAGPNGRPTGQGSRGLLDGGL